MKKHLIFTFLVLLFGSLSACARDNGTFVEIPENNNEINPNDSDMDEKFIKIYVGETTFAVKLEDNSSTKSLVDHLKQGDIQIDMNDYARMEKVGELPFSLPQNNRQLHTVPGDIILYLGRYFVIYYGNNDYSLTKLGTIEGDYSGSELKRILGNGEVTVKIGL